MKVRELRDAIINEGELDESMVFTGIIKLHNEAEITKEEVIEFIDEAMADPEDLADGFGASESEHNDYAWCWEDVINDVIERLRNFIKYRKQLPKTWEAI
jgi:hypothetical protein